MDIFHGSNKKKELLDFQRSDIVFEIEKKFEDDLSGLYSISTIECRIPHGCVFKFDLQEDQFCMKVEFQLYTDDNNWKVVNTKKQATQYYLTKKKNATLIVKVENLFYENEKINFKFSFQDSKKIAFQRDCPVNITGNCYYELKYKDLFIATPEPISNNEFSSNIKTLKSLDWRKINNICLDKVPDDESIELIALDYFNRNFPDWNDVIYVSTSIANNDNLDFVVSKFIDLFTVNGPCIRAVFPGYRLRYHASLLKCNFKNFKNYNDENRITMFFSDLNLVIFARIATSMNCLKQEFKSCLNDVILFVNVNNTLIDSNKLIILGIVVLPLHDREQLKEGLFFYFSEKFNLDQLLFICKDDFEDENFECWWRSVVAYCNKKPNPQNNELLFKKLISLTMILMSKVDHCYPTFESDTQKQIQTLILNLEQRNAINNKALRKIITGGYGSGKSIVGKEIVKNCIEKSSKNPFTLYYICCNHFSLYECQMKEFVESIEKPSNVEVVCENLYKLWKIMCKNKSISNMKISLPKILEYLAFTSDKQVCFVLEELSEEYVKLEDATQIKKLFASLLKESLVVFIPESVTKNRELVTKKQKRTLQKNFFQKEIIDMEVISLKKSMRVTECNKLLIDIAQKTICETKSFCNIPNNDFRLLQESKNVKDDEKIEHTLQYDFNDTINVNKDNSYASVKIKKDNSYVSNITINETVNKINDTSNSIITNNETVDNFTDFKSDESSIIIENKPIHKNVNDFHDIDLDYIVNIIPTSTNDIDPNSHMETEYVFKSGNMGHSIKGEKPKVIYLPFYNITEKQSVKLISVVLEKLCFNILRKTVVICNNIEEVQSITYAINIIKNFKAVPYSPHLQKYSPTLEEKFKIYKNLKSERDILVTDCKGFSGAESESVIVFVSPEEIYFRHILVDAISRSNAYLTVFVKSFNGNKELLNSNKTMKYVLDNWSEKVVEKITVATSNTENQILKDGFFIVNKNSKAFIDRGSNNDFEKHKKNLQFQIFHENNIIYETMANDLSNQVNKEFKKDSYNSSKTDYSSSSEKDSYNSSKTDYSSSSKKDSYNSWKNAYFFSSKEDCLSKSDDFNDYHRLFIECFYESESSFTDKIISIVDKRDWVVSIKDGKTSYNTSCENYFLNHYIKSGRKLSELHVDKNILSDEEESLLYKCSISVRIVEIHRPTKIKEWKPKNKIEVLRISISDYLIAKKDFEEIFFPWLDLCGELVLKLHDDIDFFEDFFKWIRQSNIKKFKIKYRGNDFCNL